MRYFMILLLKFIIISILLSRLYSHKVPSGIPLGIVLDSNVHTELRFFAEKAIKHVNTDLRSVRVRWNFQINRIRIDTFDLLTTSKIVKSPSLILIILVSKYVIKCHEEF